jgi:hypothetical protein
MSFLIIGNQKSDDVTVKPNGSKQIFVHTAKMIKSDKTDLSPYSFKNKVNDSLHEAFRMYTFDFDKDSLTFDYFWMEDNGDVSGKQVILKFEVIKSDNDFALLKYKDTTNYYNKIEDKFFIVNLKDNPNFPKLQELWLDGGLTSGVYSVDTRPFELLIPNIKESIFEY